MAMRSSSDRRNDLGNTIQSLPDHCRQIFVFREIDELNIDQIAGKRDLTTEAAKATLHRTREQFRESLFD